MTDVSQVAYDLLAESMTSRARQIEAMRQGREHARLERRRRAVERVNAYTAWLRAGSDLHTMPEVPTDADFRIAKGQG